MKKILIAVVLAAINHAGAAAQQVPFLDELLSRHEEFNRLYVEKRRAGANVAAIEALRRRGEDAFKRFDIPAILAIEGEALALLEGKAWDDRQRFISSLTLDTDRLVVEPNKELQVSLTRMFPASIEKAFATTPTVTFEVVAVPKGESTPLSGPIVLAQKTPIAESINNASRKLLLADGVYYVVARIEAGGRTVAEIKRPFYAISYFSDQIEQAAKAIADIKASADPKVKSLAPFVATLEFKLKRLAVLNQARGEVGINPQTEMSHLRSSISAVAKGRDRFARERGEVERAYQASDGQLVPYRVYVPQSYDGQSARPLVLMLHGALGDERSYFSGLFDPQVVKGEAERRGYILVGLNGRGMVPRYEAAGKEDVFEVLKAVTRDYKIDPSRVYLTGHSMGAAGAWLAAAERPDVFAAIAPVSGGPVSQNAAFVALLEKVKRIPVLVVHGGRDGIIAPQHSRDAVAAAQKMGLKITLLEVADADHLSVVAASLPAILDFFEKNQRAAPSQ